MKIIYLLPFLVTALSWLDRQRGMPRELETIPKLVALLGIGYICATLVGHWLDWQAIVITLSIAFIHNFSFGEPLGHALTGHSGTADDGTTYEKWQLGVLKTNPWLALAVRGAMLGIAGLVALDLVAAIKIAIAWAIAFPLAPAFVRYVLKLPTTTEKQSGKAWAVNEWTRGAIAGFALSVFTII